MHPIEKGQGSPCGHKGGVKDLLTIIRGKHGPLVIRLTKGSVCNRSAILFATHPSAFLLLIVLGHGYGEVTNDLLMIMAKGS